MSVPGFEPFYGTSAAAPHAAAITALVWSQQPGLDNAAVRDILEASCIDIEDPGREINSGFGILMADLALGSAPIATPTATAGATETATAGATETATETPTSANTPTPQGATCVGDCDQNGMVAINELIRGVNIALGNAALASCASVDTDDDRRVAVNQLIRAVRNALSGCPS